MGASVAPSAGEAGWSLPLSLALLAESIPTDGGSQLRATLLFILGN